MTDATYERAFKHDRFERIYFAERKDAPAQWTVEGYDDDGSAEAALFVGPGARGRAVSYLSSQYGIELPPSAGEVIAQALKRSVA